MLRRLVSDIDSCCLSANLDLIPWDSLFLVQQGAKESMAMLLMSLAF
jgi:hypothetical protein